VFSNSVFLHLVFFYQPKISNRLKKNLIKWEKCVKYNTLDFNNASEIILFILTQGLNQKSSIGGKEEVADRPTGNSGFSQ